MHLTEDEQLFAEFLESPQYFNEYRLLAEILRPLEGKHGFYKIMLTDLLKNYESTSLKPENKFVKPFPETVVDFVKADGVNAFATKYKGKYLIGIHEAAQLILFDLFLRILSYDHLLTSIGDVKVEKNPADVLEYYFPTVKQLVRNGHNGVYNAVRPKDKARESYAEHLTFIANLYLFHHELAHILFGHVDYQRTLGHFTMSEAFPFNEISSEARFDLQTLEMDADCGALVQTVGYLLYLGRNKHLVHPNFHSFLEDPYEVLSDVFFSAYNMLKLFGDVADRQQL